MLALFFEVCPRPGMMQRYLDIAAAMRPLVDQSGGCLFLDRFKSLDREGWLLSYDQLDHLVEVRCPALVIVGEEDRGTPVAVARLIHERIAASEMLVIPAAGHLPNVEQPEVFNRALLDFLDRVSAGA